MGIRGRRRFRRDDAKTATFRVLCDEGNGDTSCDFVVDGFLFLDRGPGRGEVIFGI